MPVIYLHASGYQQATDTQIEALSALGLTLCSKLEHSAMQQTKNGYDQPGKLLQELSERFSGQAVIFLRAGLQLSRQHLAELLSLQGNTDTPQVLSMLSNADRRVNPFAGLRANEDCGDLDAQSLISLLAPGQLHSLYRWPDHFTLLSATAVECLAGSNDFLPALQTAKGQLLLADHLFLTDPDRKLFEALNLQPHESATPPAFSELSYRLQQWLDAGICTAPASATDQAATLHITHSWGGGVAQWLQSFIETDKQHAHFQLRSEDTSSDMGFGQKLSLYFGNELRSPLASWWLQPAIQSLDDRNEAYQQILKDICARHAIGRIFVSSLVGHSLDALRQPLPTLQILHDHFPVWPLLSVSPHNYLRNDQPADLALAIQENHNQQEFPDKDSTAWEAIRTTWLQTISEHKVKLAAPGQSVFDLQTGLLPAFAALKGTVIPHGLPAMAGAQPIKPVSRDDGRLRLVILGRMQAGKGQQLLLDALPQLGKYVQIYLIGSGKSGEAFFGIPSVDVVIDYQRDQLADILAKIGPHFGALLSLVPETFSYTLSELQQFQIPAIATALGSFPQRIEHGNTGWLVKPDASELIKQVRSLCEAPEQIETVRQNLSLQQTQSLQKMTAAYNELCATADNAEAFKPAFADHDASQKAAANFDRLLTSNDLNQALAQQSKLKQEVERRTKWAKDTSLELQQEQKRREKWVAQLDAEIARQQTILEDIEAELTQVSANYRQVSSDYQRVSDLNTLILNSASWKITRPFRAARRVLRNFMLARAWNPLRWPWLLSQMIRNLATLGLSGTLERMQYQGANAAPEPQAMDELEAIGDPQAPAAFPVTANPDVSIVIPVYNKWTYTAACLRSLLEIKSKYSFEVIVVDDQSSDDTATRLSDIDGLVDLRNDKNLGFVGSCNRGAAAAKGEYLVLLNNDTQVLEGWLDELIDSLKREPEAGLVGARLLYPDGSLQESGGIIFSDGSGWNYGRNSDAEDPKYHFLREVDYCSGACIALKTKYFHDIGALDERYAPAYYEDTDLAFKVRESGRKVFVQPLSAIIHHEGITSGTDTGNGTKKYQISNQKKFVERWQTELSSQPAAISNPEDQTAVLNASQRGVKGRILVIDATTPEPDKDSGSVRLTNMMQCCRQLGYGVTFFADNRDYAGSYTRELQRTGIEVLYHPWLESLSKFFRQRGADFDYIFISRHYIAINYISLLKRYCPEAHFIFDTVDLHYLREQRLAELENSLPLKRTAAQTRRAELSVIEAADATLVVSTVEQQVLAEDASSAKVHILSNIHHVPGRTKAFSERQDIYFVGGYQHPPNIDAACWFVNDIWPLIHARLPQMRFHLIGSNAPEKVRALSGEGVVFHGFVDSLDSFLSDCKLAVAPLRYGAGVKGKVNMSMAHGQPVVATPAGVEGMFAEHEREILVAQDAQAFADEVVRLYEDEELWNRLSDASIQNVEEHFSLKTARESLKTLFNSVLVG